MWWQLVSFELLWCFLKCYGRSWAVKTEITYTFVDNAACTWNVITAHKFKPKTVLCSCFLPRTLKLIYQLLCLLLWTAISVLHLALPGLILSIISVNICFAERKLRVWPENQHQWGTYFSSSQVVKHCLTFHFKVFIILR